MSDPTIAHEELAPARAVVLERRGELALRDIALPRSAGPGEVRIAVHTVGICGSDVHYYQHGRIGDFVVRAPMVLGHEAAGTVVETGAGVTGLAPGDRVCMEPGIPDRASREARLGMYNVDRSVRFWATPPVHGCLTPQVVHPADFVFKLPDNVSFAEGAMVEPFAVGLQAVQKARLVAGDVGAVLGAGPIGYMVALAALAGGCSRVVIADVQPGRLAAAARYPGLVPVDLTRESAAAVVERLTGGWGADVVFEASGSPKAYEGIAALPRPGGCIVLIGMPPAPPALDACAAMVKELRIESVFRYAHQYGRALDLIGSGKVDLKPLITATFGFEDAIQAFERAAENRPSDVKLQIRVQQPG